MAWSVPLTAVPNAPLTSAQWNLSVRDTLLETAPAKAATTGSYFVTTAPNTINERTVGHNYVGDNETTGSTSYVDLATTGPSVTVTSSARVIACVSCITSNTTVGAYSAMSVDVSGATTLGPTDVVAARATSSTANASYAISYLTVFLVSGANTYQGKYRVSAGTGSFSSRRLIILPF